MPAPPAAIIDAAEKPEYKLFAVSAVVLASVFGSFMAAGILMAINFKRLGKPASVWTVLSMTGLAMIGFAAYLFSFNPDNPIAAPFYFAVPPVLVFMVARLLQHQALVVHRAAGGRLANIAWAAWFGVACGAVTFLLMYEAEEILRG